MNVVRELGLEVPSGDEARWRFVQRWATDLVEGRRSPIEAARLIWWEGWEELAATGQTATDLPKCGGGRGI